VGTETTYADEMLVTRVKGNPPTWLVEKYTPKGKFHLMLMKAEKGSQKALSWSLMGEGYLTMHSTRGAALRAAQALEPVVEADCLHCGQVIEPGEQYCDEVCAGRGLWQD
jgi:hypothetical protein